MTVKSEAQGAALTAASRSPVAAQLGECWAASVSLGRAQDFTIGAGFLDLVRGNQFERGESGINLFDSVGGALTPPTAFQSVS